LFDVPAGQVVGVIGRNGAGKSTLLKILSRITEPTTGHAEIRGRVGSLLEVGTGFHPELTGRENLFLSGAILGMKRVEIERKFAEIVEFAEVEKFIDTPVKHYSSGMFLRLAFAVAAHLEPEILVVDEVLAVGDAAFQKKCMGKMDEVAGHGRTVLFVSHNMAAVNQLCDRCLLLHDGAVVFDGETAEGIDRYLKMANRGMGHAVLDAALAGKRPAAGKGQIVKVEIHDAEGTTSTFFGIGEPFTVRLHAKFYERVAQVSLGLQFESPTGMPLLNLRTDSQGVDFGPYDAGSTVVFSIRVPGLPFYPGVYKFEPWFAERNGKRIDQIHDGLAVTIEGKGRFESEKMIQPGRGLVMMDCAWSDEKLS
jgi:lipopolysaccharide transport system ATP-binding protein